MATGATLSIRIDAKRFGAGAPPLFAGLSLDVAASEVVALVGPSGVGKSTLLRMVAGADRDFEGRIEVDGRPADRAPTPGFVFQDPRLLPWLDAEANVRAAGPGVVASEARDLLAAVGLGDCARALPHELSGGMQRRVGLARAMAVRPALLLLDEPFVSLDAALVLELTALLADLLEASHPTVLLVSHTVEDAARLADRVVALAGRPARVVADRGSLPPRAARGPEEVARLAGEIARWSGMAG